MKPLLYILCFLLACALNAVLCWCVCALCESSHPHALYTVWVLLVVIVVANLEIMRQTFLHIKDL